MGKTDPKSKSTATKIEVSGKVFERAFLPWMAFLILLHLLAMYVAPEYMWGVHFYHFYPAWIGWIMVVISQAILIPGVSESLYPKLDALAKKVKKPFDSMGQNKSFLILSFLSLPVFWIFRSRLHLLGDGYFRITDLPEGRLHLQEWLDAFIHLVVYRVMVKLIPTWTPELTYSIISVLCGGAFVYLTLKLSVLLGKTGLGRVLIFAFLISLGSVQLFFGYVESYSILQVALLAYILFTAKYLFRRASIFPALAAFVVSIGLHVTSLVFVPSFVYLLLRKDSGRSGKKGSAARRKMSPLVLAGLIVASCLVIFWVYTVATGLQKTGKGIFILPLIATEDYSFGMFSLAHVSEFVNQLLLLSPLGISLIVFFLFFKIKHREFRDKFINFLILAASFALVYLFAFNFTLGSADWDLMSMPAPFIGLLGILLFLRWAEKPSTVHCPLSTDQSRSDVDKPMQEKTPKRGSLIGKRFGAWGVIFIWFCLFHTLPWVLINAHDQRSADRYILIQENDPHPVDETGYNLYKIQRILRLAGLREEAKEVYERAIQKDPSDTLSYLNLAVLHHRDDMLDQELLVLDNLLTVAPQHPVGNWKMGNVHFRKGNYVRAIPYMKKAYPFLDDNPDFLYQLAMTHYRANHLDEAAVFLERTIKHSPEFLDAYQLLAATYTQLGKHDRAEQTWRHVLTIDPSDSAAAKILGELEKDRTE